MLCHMQCPCQLGASDKRLVINSESPENLLLVRRLTRLEQNEREYGRLAVCRVGRAVARSGPGNNEFEFVGLTRRGTEFEWALDYDVHVIPQAIRMASKGSCYDSR